MAELTPDRARRLGLDTVHGGVLVVDVEPASFADDVNALKGDVIVEVNRQPINSVAEFHRELGKLKPGQNAVFKVMRRGDRADQILTVYLAGPVPADSH